MSFDRDSLIRLFNKMVSLREEMGWFSKKKLDKALKEWQHEDRIQYSILREVMVELDNMEK